jgi:hypothetical protein
VRHICRRYHMLAAPAIFVEEYTCQPYISSCLSSSFRL